MKGTVVIFLAIFFSASLFSFSLGSYLRENHKLLVDLPNVKVSQSSVEHGPHCNT